MRIAHQRAVRLRRAKRSRTPDEKFNDDMLTLKQVVNRVSHRWGAKHAAIAVAEEFKAMGHPKELRRHL